MLHSNMIIEPWHVPGEMAIADHCLIRSATDKHFPKCDA